jgi:adenosylcobinamide-phosphate synthase
MNFIAILVALLLEQGRPLGPDNPVHRVAVAWARWARRSLDAGEVRQGWLAWLLAAAVPAGFAGGVYLLLSEFSVVLSLFWLVLVLYVTLGFRQFSHHFTAIREALESGDEDAARAELATWQQVEVGRLPRSEIVRHVIEHSALSAHRHVFGVLLAFIVLAICGLGPAGAVLYRMAEFLSRRWIPRPEDPPSEAAISAARLAWHWIDWLPSRVTALAFAVVGNFEEAIATWRQDAGRLGASNDAVVLAATSGAINVRLGGRALGAALPGPVPEGSMPTEGREPQQAHLASLVGLVWRAVVMWLLLMALMTLARAVG